MNEILKDGSEKVIYDYDGYFAYIRRGFLSHYPNYSADSHWHDDLEFIYIISGEMDYNINGEIVTLHTGEGIFVNSRHIHFGFSHKHAECEFLCVLLHPILLCSTQSFERDFVLPFLSSQPFVVLSDNIPWQKSINCEIKEIYSKRECEAAPVYIQNSFYIIFSRLFENSNPKSDKTADRKLSILKDMLNFIHKNFSEKLTLSEIAKSGNVSKSTCSAIFKKYLKDTPANYLISYRLKTAAKLLRETDMNIAEISTAVGFLSISFFTKTFRENFKVTPTKFRKNSPSS